MKFKLENYSTGDVEELILDSPKIKIGRSLKNKITLKDLHASRSHAEIVQSKGKVRLKDLDSESGTYLNGKKISSEKILKNGDTIRIGDHIIHCVDIRFAKERKEALSLLGTLDKIQMLRKINLFQGLLFDDLAAISNISQPCMFKRGAIIFRQNDPGDSLYVIMEGGVDILIQGKAGEQIVGQMKAPEYFGEMAILDDQKRSASAKASESSLLLRIRKGDFRKLLGAHPKLVHELLGFLSTRIRKLDKEIHDKT